MGGAAAEAAAVIGPSADSQQPIDSDEQADVLGGQAHRCQDKQHGDQSGAGDAGGAHTGQGSRHAGEKEERS